MIERRRPILSAIANRKMFMGGGLATAMPQPTYMDLMPQQMGLPREAQGIMASSQPLVDAIAGDANNPYGGDTLSMAQGGSVVDTRPAYVFQEGGGIRLGETSQFLPPSKVVAETVIKSAGAPTSLERVGTSREEQAAFMRSDPSYLEGVRTTADRLRESKNYDEDFKAFLTNKNFSDEMKRDVTELLSTTLTKQQIAAKTGSNLVQRIQSGDGYAEAERDADMQITENVYGSGPELVQRIQSGDGYAEAERDANMQITENVYGSGGEQGDSPTKSSVLITKWLKDNPDKSSEEAPLETVDTTVDNLFSDAIEALENKKFDVEKFKGEIDALLPTVEEDPEMEGALITMLGAAIMSGTDPNWVVNLGKGIERAMPAFINYRTKQKEKINARDMSIAKMAIKTKLAREAETRTAIRGLETQKRGLKIDLFKASEADKRALAKEGRTMGNYMVTKTTSLPGTTFDPKAKEDSVVTIPFNTKMNLSRDDAQRLQNMGIPLFETGKVSISYDDIIKSATPIDPNSFANMDPEDWNRLATQKQKTFFAFGTAEGLKLDYFLPQPFGIKKGINSPWMLDNQWAALYTAYDRYRGKFESLGDKITTLQTLAKSGKLTGLGGLKGRIGDTMRALRALPFASDLADSLLGGEQLSAGAKFDVNSRLVLAEIAPFILGESGKTISDADRVRVAQVLGYQASLDENGFMKIEGWDKQLLKNPANVQYALQTVAGVINKYIALGDSQMASALIEFGRVSPEQSAKILDGMGRNQAQDTRARVSERVGVDITKEKTAPIIHLDLTKI